MELQYDDSILIKRGDQFLSIGQYQNAINSYGHIHSTHPGYKHAIFQKEKARHNMHQNCDAIQCNYELFATDPDNLDMLFYKNRVLQPEKTIEYLDKALELHDNKETILSPSSLAIALLYKGEAFYYSGKSREAIECLDKALLNAGKTVGKEISEFKKFVVGKLENPEIDETVTTETKK